MGGSKFSVVQFNSIYMLGMSVMVVLWSTRPSAARTKDRGSYGSQSCTLSPTGLDESSIRPLTFCVLKVQHCMTDIHNRLTTFNDQEQLKGTTSLFRFRYFNGLLKIIKKDHDGMTLD